MINCSRVRAINAEAGGRRSTTNWVLMEIVTFMASRFPEIGNWCGEVNSSRWLKTLGLAVA